MGKLLVELSQEHESWRESESQTVCILYMNRFRNCIYKMYIDEGNYHEASGF